MPCSHHCFINSSPRSPLLPSLKEAPLVNVQANLRLRLKGFRWHHVGRCCLDLPRTSLFKQEKGQPLGTRNHRVLICHRICIRTILKTAGKGEESHQPLLGVGLCSVPLILQRHPARHRTSNSQNKPRAGCFFCGGHPGMHHVMHPAEIK